MYWCSSLISKIFGREEGEGWNKFLDSLDAGPCARFEYVRAYSSFEGDGEPLMFVVEEGGERFAHVFIKYESWHFDSANNESFVTHDIVSPYGYAGALTTSFNEIFIEACWRAFDEWTSKESIVCEFLRGPPSDEMPCVVHPDIVLADNRLISLISCDLTDDDYLGVIKAKQRNMVRRAISEDCKLVEYDLTEALPWFEPWYREVMDNSSAPERFYYDSDYYSSLQGIGRNLKIICVEQNSKKLAAAIVIFGASYNLYHLSATNPNFRVNYASPFLVFGCKKACSRRNQKPLVLGGGRTSEPEDSLFRFKQSVGSRLAKYKIGTRIINPEVYHRLKTLYPVSESRLIFYR